nr:MAG TPA: hypothetical protein [Caudoviricetes sp.]
MQKRGKRLLILRRQTYRPNTENGSGTALLGCENIVEVYDYCRRRKWNT